VTEYYDIDGNPLTTLDWVVLLESRDMTEYGVIGNTYIGDVRVSTIWLGLNHNFGDGPPLIFETMIFGLPDEDEVGEYQWRYSTKEAALAGHDQAVALVKHNHPVC
jgi:hypothetical protein